MSTSQYCPPHEIRNVFVSSNSRDTTQYPNGNKYNVHLTTPIKDIVKVELLHCSVPNSMYNLTDGSNVIAFSNTTTGSGVTPAELTTFSIPPGFYSASGLATELTNATSNNAGMSVTYISSQGKFLFKRPTATGAFTMNVTSNNLATMVGLTASTMIDSSTVAVQTDTNLPLFSDNSTYLDQDFVRSTTLVDLNPNEGVFLDIKELRTSFNEQGLKVSGSNGTYSGQNMTRSFGMIPMDVSGGAIKRFKKTSDFDFGIDYPYPIQTIDRLSVEWIDKDGQLLDFNGLNDNSFLLRFHTLRRNICSV
jgi:hypothetical protein